MTNREGAKAPSRTAMKVKFVKSALTIVGRVEAGQVVEVSVLDREFFVKSGLAVDFSEPEKTAAKRTRSRRTKNDES